MSNIEITEYKEFIQQIKQKAREAQIKASIRVISTNSSEKGQQLVALLSKILWGYNLHTLPKYQSNLAHNIRSLVGCCFQRTTKPNTHKITLRRKAYFTLFKRLFFLSNIGAIAIAPYVRTLSGNPFFLPIFICGALKTAPYELKYMNKGI